MSDRARVVLTAADCQWLGGVLDHLRRRGELDRYPSLHTRVDVLLTELAAVARFADSPGQPLLDDDPAPHIGCVNYIHAGQLLDVSERTVRRLVAQGKLPAVPIGGARRIRVSDLVAFVEAL
jgi:excisionase family DNA binding protein